MTPERFTSQPLAVDQSLLKYIQFKSKLSESAPKMHVGEPGEIISPGFSQSVLPLHDAGQKATDPKHALEETGAFFSVADADLSPDLFESVLQSDVGLVCWLIQHILRFS